MGKRKSWLEDDDRYHKNIAMVDGDIAFIPKADQNFHSISGKSVIQGTGGKFKEYRRQWYERPKNYDAGSFPLHLDIEASTVCNLHCPFCATNYKKTTGGLMTMATFKKAIDEGMENSLCAIKLNSGARGEPLLNPLASEMVGYAKKKGVMDIYFNTNATLLTPAISEKLIKSGLNRISISFEGTTKEVYEHYRIGATYEKVLGNIKELARLKRTLGSPTPLIRVQTVALPELVPKLDEYKTFWEKIVDEVAFIDYKDYSNLDKNLASKWACPYLWQRLLVRWDGSIGLCQFDYGEKALGNINKGDTIKKIWNDKLGGFVGVRDLHKSGMSNLLQICNKCAFRATEITKLGEKK